MALDRLFYGIKLLVDFIKNMIRLFFMKLQKQTIFNILRLKFCLQEMFLLNLTTSIT
jgi:hypothetical protein